MDPTLNFDAEATEANYDRCIGFTHVIKKGDTLYKLSKQYNVKVSALILANPYVNIYNLQVGDTICIPRIRPVVIPVVPGASGGQELPPMPPERPRPQEPMQPPMPPERPRPQEPMQPPMPPDRPRPQEPMQPPMPPDRPRPQEPASPEEGMLPTPEVIWEIRQQEERPMIEMTVRELLDEWDISYPMLETVMDIIKKMKKIL